MRTLIVSDLHLGSRTGSGLLSSPELRDVLLSELATADRVVLLGDVVELRHGPARDAIAAARPFFKALGEAMAGREIVITAGNHDHQLIEPWLAARGEEHEPPALTPEQLIDPRDASRAYARIAEWVTPARLLVAYPGLWVRPDVYATHGHYLDCHLTIPTLERLTMAAMMRALRRPTSELRSVADYEAISAPVFAWRDVVTRDTRSSAAVNGVATISAWRALRGSSERESDIAHRDGAIRPPSRARSRALSGPLSRRLAGSALAAGFPIAVAALNRAGLGPFRADISSAELRRAGLRAMGEVADRIGLGDSYVVFGHTHRTGPLPGDDPAEWVSPGGGRLVNSGSWAYASIFLTDTPGESPYWPGAVVVVEDRGAPVVERLLQDVPRERLRPPRRNRDNRAGAGRGEDRSPGPGEDRSSKPGGEAGGNAPHPALER